MINYSAKEIQLFKRRAIYFTQDRYLPIALAPHLLCIDATEELIDTIIDVTIILKSKEIQL